MSTWHRVPLTALASYVNGYPFKPEDHGQDGLPIVRIEQLKDPDTRYDYFDGKVPRENYMADGDLIFSWSASLFLRIWDRGPAILNQHLFKVIPNPDIDKLFLKYCIEHNLPDLTKASHGSTMQHITRRELERFHVEVPASKTEQTAIADILTTVDRAIEQTEALIAKQRRIKAGLLHDLLTRGIDEHGHLRDPSTHRFKPSSVGLVPEEWEVINLGSIVDRYGGVIQTGPFGSQLHADEYTDEGVPFVMPQDISPEGVLILESAAKIPQHRAQDLRRHLMKENDVLFARRGDLSRCAAIRVNDIAVAGSGCMLVRVPKSAMIGEWLVHMYKHERSQRQIMARAVGSTMVNLNSTLLRDLIVMLPKNAEQERILFVLGMANELDLATQLELNKLTTLKAGLMQDLLSGRVSVAELGEKAPLASEEHRAKEDTV